MTRVVLAAVDDMIFAAKIRGTAEQSGIEVVFPRSAEALTAAKTAALIVVDLHLQRYDPFALARILKGIAILRDVPLVGFFSHVQMELLHRAEAAGFNHVWPRSAFTKRLPEILQGRF